MISIIPAEQCFSKNNSWSDKSNIQRPTCFKKKIKLSWLELWSTRQNLSRFFHTGKSEIFAKKIMILNNHHMVIKLLTRMSAAFMKVLRKYVEFYVIYITAF